MDIHKQVGKERNRTENCILIHALRIDIDAGSVQEYVNPNVIWLQPIYISVQSLSENQVRTP